MKKVAATVPKFLIILSLLVVGCQKEVNLIQPSKSVSNSSLSRSLSSEDIGLLHLGCLDAIADAYAADSTSSFDENLDDIMVVMKNYAVNNDYFTKEEFDENANDVRSTIASALSIFNAGLDSTGYSNLVDSIYSEANVISYEIKVALQDMWGPHLESNVNSLAAIDEIFLQRSYTDPNDQKLAATLYYVFEGSIDFAGRYNWTCGDSIWLMDGIGLIYGLPFGGIGGLVAVGFSWAQWRNCTYGSL